MARVDRCHDRCWVDRGTAARVHLEVQVRGGGVARRAIGAENLTGFHDGANGDVRGDRVEVGVEEVR
ncbi:MAG: hypothetical protein RLZZ332_306, partial [Actinomycetota bacterium]